MNLYLLENDSSVDFVRSLSHYEPKRDMIICFNYLCYLKLVRRNAQANFIFCEELLSEQDYAELHSATDRFAQNWYKMAGKDETLLDGISYGELVETMFSRKYMVSILVKYGEVIRKAVKRWPSVDSLYYDFSNSENYFFLYFDDKGTFFNKQVLVKTVAEQLRLRTYHLEAEELIPSAHIGHIYITDSGFTIKRRLAYWLGDGISFVNYFTHRGNRLSGNTYLFISANSMSYLKYAFSSLILSGFPQQLLHFKSFKTLFSGISFLTFHRINYYLNSLEKQFLQSLKDIFCRDAYEFSFNDIDYSLFYKKIIEDIITNIVPGLMKYVGKVRRGIRKNSITTLIVNEEIDEQIKAVIAAAHLEGAKSVFVDHGIQGHNHAQKVFDRNKSEIIICSGDFYKRYYISNCSKNRQCLALGNPSLDPYASVKRKKVKKIRKVLFLTFEDNFYARLDRFAIQEMYYAEIFSIFDELVSMGIEVHYKPHPGERREYNDYIMRFFAVNQDNIHYIENRSFESVIWDMDLLVSNVSACYYESLAAGIPVIFLEPNFIPDALLPPLNSNNPEEVIRV